MMDMMQGYMVRIFAGGIICAAAMIVAGDGAKKEIVRLCCACLMIIFVLTPIQGADFSLEALLDDREAVERQIQEALSTAKDSQLETVRRELIAHVEGLAAREGIAATVDVSCHVDNRGSLVIHQVTVSHRHGQPEALTGLIRQIMTDFDILDGQITVKEAAGT